MLALQRFDRPLDRRAVPKVFARSTGLDGAFRSFAQRPLAPTARVSSRWDSPTFGLYAAAPTRGIQI
jgi:hypothetical protein